jgi:vacuolar protein sorting-associated protein 8
MEGMPSGSVADLLGHYRRNISALLRACVATSHFQLLYDEVHRRVEKDLLSRQIFLELLEELVVEGRLDQPPPALVHAYLSQLLAAEDVQLAIYERSVTKLPVESLDLHQVITTCRANQLFDGLIYVANEAMRDYRTPIEEMLEVVRGFVAKEVLSDCEVAQGNKLLLYLSCCLVSGG